MNKLKNIMILLVIVAIWGCKEEFLNPTVSTDKDVGTNVSTIDDINALLVGAYNGLSDVQYYGRDFVVFAEVRSDNSYSTGSSGRFINPARFDVAPTDAYPTDTWEQIYIVIANTNIIINSEVEDGDSELGKHIKGQAYAIRALAHYDLLRLYGQMHAGGDLGIPVVMTFGDPDALYPSRNTITQVYDQIKSDLAAARNNMSDALGATQTETTIRPLFIPALESRLYLDLGDYAKAEAAALEVIGEFALEDNSWGTTGTGQIFSLAFNATDNPNINGLYNIYQETNYGDVEVTDELYNLYEAGDDRLAQFTSYDGDTRHRTGKYPTPDYTDNVRVLRYAEVLLNYAEALIRQDGNTTASLNALNEVPTARNATAYTEANLDNILNERRKELEFEGHRFFDLMRFQKDIVKVDPRQTLPDAGIPYGDSNLAFPIPNVELVANSNMEQNDDY